MRDNKDKMQLLMRAREISKRVKHGIYPYNIYMLLIDKYKV